MATSKEAIRHWLKEGKKNGATHVIIVCDTFDYEDYPVYVEPGQDVRKVAEEFNGKNMQKIMEVYSLKLDIEAQLKEYRAFNWE